MAICPNINLESWKNLVASRGEDMAYYLWDFYKGNVPQEEYVSPIKPGVAELFNSIPELASIGTPEQYSAYLDSIFPDSKVKDIVYHGTTNTFDKFELGHTNAAGKKTNTEGFHFIAEPGKSFYKERYGKLISVLLDIKNPVKDSRYEKALEYLSKRDKAVFKSEGYDSGVKYFEDEDGEFEYVVFEPEQIHILGGKQDVEGFKQFVGKQSGETYFQASTKNVLNSVAEIENNLKAVNKSADSIGSTVKLDSVLKKAGLNSELRAQFINIIDNNPQLKKIKLSNVLSTYLREIIKDADRAYHTAINEPLDKGLEKTLINYFDKFYIRREEINNLKEKFGVDSVGVFDVLAKTIYYSKNRNLLTLPEEYGHVFVELLGSIHNRKADNPLFKYLFDNIENWDGYKRVFDQYKSLYVTKEGNYDIYKIKKEAIGQAIGIALVRNYKNNKKANASLWEKIQEVIDYIADMLEGISYANINIEVDNIAKDILSNNYSRLKRLNKDTSNYNLLSYEETIENQNKKDGGLALGFMQWFSGIGNIITGSLAYRLQGTTYRPEIDALHDIDMIVPSDVHKVDLKKSTYLTPEQLEQDRLYRKYITEGNYREARKYKLSGNIKLDPDVVMNNEYFKKIKEKYPDLDYLYTFYNEKANAFYITANAIWSKNQELKNRFKSYTGSFNDRLLNFTQEELDQIYLFDFFLRPETSEQYKTVADSKYNLTLAHFNYAFYEKLNMMGRPKDAYDYQNWQYFDKENILPPDLNDRMVYFQLQNSEENAAKEESLEEQPSQQKQPAALSLQEQKDRLIDKFNLKLIKRYVGGIGAIGYTTKNDKITPAFFKNIAEWVRDNPLYQGFDMVWDKGNNLLLFREKTTRTFFQTEDMPMSRASEETIAKVKKVLEKMGVSIEELQKYAKDANLNIPGGVNGLADIAKRIVAVAEGREDVSLTEEMVHIATAILEQKNPALVTEMISKIDRFAIYKTTFEAYKNNPKYQLPNGKPNIRKIKKEAVDKLIAELIIYGNEGSTDFPELFNEENQSLIKKWWQKILDWFGVAYKKANIDIFEQTARQIMQGELSSEGVDLSGYDEYYQVSDAQKVIQQRIIDKSKNIRKVVEKGPVDPLFMDTEEASNYYEGKQPDGTWKRITKRVTDRVKAWYRSKFPGRVFSEEEKRFNEFKRKLGVKFHGYFEDIHGRFFNPENGERRTGTLPRDVKFDNQEDEIVYNELENYFVGLINKFSKGGKSPLVFSEVMLYDEKAGEAGTIDLLIIEENGKANILDWKFMSASAEAKDVAWYKQGAYDIQLRRYKDILRERYGVKEFGMNRAIPIIMKTQLENIKDKKSQHVLKGIAIGSVDATKIEDLVLLPVSESTESTGFSELDDVIKKLNAVLKQVSKEDVTSTKEYEFKRDRLNIIREAIRKLQTGADLLPLINVINVMSREGDILLNDYKMKYEGKPVNSKGADFDPKALSDYSSALRQYTAFAKVFGNITDYIGKYIYNEQMEKEAESEGEKEVVAARKERMEEIKKAQESIRISAIKVGKIGGEFADKFIGQRNLVTGLLSPEAIIKGLSSLFRGVADLGVASLDILERMVTNAKDRGARDASAEVDKLMEIRKKIVAKGGDVRKYVQRIYQKDEKNKLVNKLIYRFKKDFYEQVDANAQEGRRSRKWLMENIDVNSYMKEANEILNEKIKRYEELYTGETLDKMILEEKRKFDINRKDFIGFSNYIIKRHPLSKWESEEYLEIKKDPELFELYNFIMGINEKAKEVGYLANQTSSSFLPFVRKSMAESLAWDFDLSAITNIGKSLSIQAETVGYGKLNELTGELENSIPKYFTYDFTRLEDGTNDYSDVSEDIFKNMILYINHMEKYKYLSEIEDQLLLVKSIEAFKGHVQTNNLGDVSTDENGNIISLGEGEKDSEGNAKLYNDFLRALLYEQKYPLSDSDTPLPVNVRNFMKKAINKVAGKEVYKEDENPSATSLMKTVDAVNTGFQLKTLGLEFISGAVNAFGSNIQVASQSGNYFKSREVLANEVKLLGNKWRNKEEYEAFVKLVDLFLPLREDPNYEKMKKAGLNSFTNISASDTLMMFMKYPEQHLEKSIFLTLLENTMVEDGKLVNINEFVKRKYQGRSGSAAAYREASAKIAEEVKQLKKERSLYSIKKVEDGKLVIPGFDTSNIEEVQKLSRLTKRVSRNALGGMSQSDINRMGLNIWTKSMMVFKNWIPKLLDTRFGEFRKVSDDFSVEIGEDGLTTGEKYDIGRIRLFAGFLHFNIFKTVKELNDVLSVNDNGLLKINELYEKYAADYKKRTGKELNMSLDDFTDLIKTNLRNQVKELLMLASMFAMAMTLGFFRPDDDEDKATKNFYRFSQRVVNKFIQELSFFYNPIEFEKLLSGSIFPAIGLFSDFGRFANHFFMEITGNELSDSDLTPEQVRKKAQPIKNLGKMFPGTKSLFTYGAIFDSEFAKEYDITIQKETGFR